MFFVTVSAQDSLRVSDRDTVKISANLTLKSMSNSLLTGGFFSQNPALALAVTASYRDFSFTLVRNSDLLDPATGANLFCFFPSYTKTWGRWSLNLIVEVDFFDQMKELDLFAPELTIARKGVVDADLFLCYARTFTSQRDIYIARGSVSKSYQGFTFGLYAWYVDWAKSPEDPLFAIESRNWVSLAGEISKEITSNWRVSVFGHFNKVKLLEHQEFGAIRIGYSF